MQRGNLGSGACSWVLETAVAAMACGRLVQFKYMVMPGVVCGNKNADAPSSEACLGKWMRRRVGVHCMTGTHAVHAYRGDCTHGAPPQRLGAPTPAGHVSAGQRTAAPAAMRWCHCTVQLTRALGPARRSQKFQGGRLRESWHRQAPACAEPQTARSCWHLGHL